MVQTISFKTAMKNAKRLFGFLMTLIMISALLPISVHASEDNILTVGTGGKYSTIQSALNAAENGDVVTLLQDFNGYFYYDAKDGKVITIDGQGHKITGEGTTNWTSIALRLGGKGIVKLKDISLIGGTSTMGDSCGLYVGDLVNLQSYGTVTAMGGYAVCEYPLGSIFYHAGYSYGVKHNGVGNVDITNAYGGQAHISYGVYNENEGAVNVVNAVGGAGSGAAGTESCGVWNDASGTVNVFAATSGTSPKTMRTGVYNNRAGVVNVGTATGGIYGVWNNGTGTVNVTKAVSEVSSAVVSASYATTNVGSIIGINDDSRANFKVKPIKLHKEAGSACVLDSIVVAASGETNVGTLPSVLHEGKYYYNWYYDNEKKCKIRETADANDIYSECYTTSNLVEGRPQENVESSVYEDSEAPTVNDNPNTGDSGFLQYLLLTVIALLFLGFEFVWLKKKTNFDDEDIKNTTFF